MSCLVLWWEEEEFKKRRIRKLTNTHAGCAHGGARGASVLLTEASPYPLAHLEGMQFTFELFRVSATILLSVLRLLCASRLWHSSHQRRTRTVLCSLQLDLAALSI